MVVVVVGERMRGGMEDENIREEKEMSNKKKET